MKHEFKHSPSYTLLHLDLQAGEQIKTEAGAMVYMSPTFGVETKFGSGFFSALGRKVLGGESLFVNIYTAQGPSVIGLATDLPGDIQHRSLNNQTMFLQSGAYVCSTGNLEIKPQFGGLKTLIGGEGLFLLKVTGTGDLFYSSYGAVIPIDVKGKYVVDTGHIVGFEDTLNFTIRKVGGWKSTFLSGEGLVCEFNGNGKLWIQTRVQSGFIGWLTRLLPG